MLVRHNPRFVLVGAHNRSCHGLILKARALEAGALASLWSLAFAVRLSFELLNRELHMLETAF